MERGMFRTDMVVAGRPVLEEIVVSVLLEVLPAGGHFGRSFRVVVLRPEIVPVVGFIDGLNVVQEAFERLSLATLIQERGGFLERSETWSMAFPKDSASTFTSLKLSLTLIRMLTSCATGIVFLK